MAVPQLSCSSNFGSHHGVRYILFMWGHWCEEQWIAIYQIKFSHERMRRPNSPRRTNVAGWSNDATVKKHNSNISLPWHFSCSRRTPLSKELVLVLYHGNDIFYLCLFMVALFHQWATLVRRGLLCASIRSWEDFIWSLHVGYSRHLKSMSYNVFHTKRSLALFCHRGSRRSLTRAPRGPCLALFEPQLRIFSKSPTFTVSDRLFNIAKFNIFFFSEVGNVKMLPKTNIQIYSHFSLPWRQWMTGLQVERAV